MCYVCQRKLSLDDFPPNKKNKDGKNRKCRDCYNEYMREWYSKNQDKHKARVQVRRDAGIARASKYGLVPSEVEAIINKYDGLCWCCQERIATAIDHCHSTGKVRGALCLLCNTGIGKLGDSIEGLQKAIDYLAGG